MSKVQSQPEVTDLDDDDVFLVGVGEDSTRRISKANLQAAFVGPAGPQGIEGPPGVGGLAGGTTGQVARKASNANHDTEWHTLDKGDVGLGSVDNTADEDKPVSAAQQDALDLKVDLDLSNVTAADFGGKSFVATGGTTARGAAVRAADFPNVKDFGAVGDGSANDATAINAVSAGAAWLPPGTFKVNSAIAAVTTALRRGLGWVRTILKAGASMTAIFYGSSGGSDLVFEDMTFDANSKASTSGVQLNGGSYKRVVFRRCRFIGTVGAWQLLIGYAAGTFGSPGSRASNLSNLSQDILIEECVFDSHTTTTLEQLILVNCKNVTVRNCTFTNNRTTTFSLLVYAFCTNVLIEGCTFYTAAAQHIGVQQSDHVTIRDCRFFSDSADIVQPISIVNSADVLVEGCHATLYTSGFNGGVFVRVYNYQGSTFESGNYTALYQGSYRIALRDNHVDGCYALLAAPGQTQSDKSFVFDDISISGGSVVNCVGIPVIIGNYSVSGTQDEGITNIAVRDLVIHDFGDTEAAILMKGRNSSHRITNVTIEGCTIPQTSGAISHGIEIDQADHIQIVNNPQILSKSTGKAIKLTNHEYFTITGNGVFGRGISFTGRIGYVKHNMGALPVEELEVLYVQAAQGTGLTAGQPVVLKSTSTGYEISLTNTAADNRVLGVLAQDIAHLDYGYVQVRGFCAGVNVNGVTDIAAGDFLATYTTEGIARKSSSGDFSFARALGAYTANDSLGSIPCLLIPPTKV